ncbi:hypothetical protein G9406_06635 [Weissella paramesenteroides]|uniref:hypothetical protein n=1 Tax=Weissella paramesenteroides TaxID=1249 RepID=UPI002402B160|nr:hypothetical protein [Weissella paramesenteroides]MDF8367252.1 hypothetical protein [Weissella paramesenteroides]
MKLQLNVEPGDLIQNISFHGETNADNEELKKLDNLEAMLSTAYLELLGLMLDTEDRIEYSAKQLHQRAEELLSMFNEDE